MGTRVLLVRHGESEWNATGRWQGHRDPMLTDEGRRQAEEAALALGTFDLIASSPLSRATETAERIAEATGIGPVIVLDDLIERAAGEWEGLTRAEIEEGWPGYLSERKSPPGFESDEFLVPRAIAALAQIADIVGDGEALAVTHGGVMNALRIAIGEGWTRIPNLGFVHLERARSPRPGDEFDGWAIIGTGELIGDSTTQLVE